MWWTLTIRPTSSASFTQVCLLCIRVATKALSDHSFSLSPPPDCPALLPSRLPLCEFECFAQLAALRPIQLVLCHAAPLFWCQLSRCLILFPQRCRALFFWPCKLWASSPLTDIKQQHCQCMLLLSVCCLVSLCLCLPLCLSLFFMEMCLASSSLVYSIWPPPLFPSSLLASIRYRLIAGAELYIQVNSWAGWPLPNAYVLCLYRIHSLLLHSECWHGYTLWVLQSLLGWTLKLWPSSVYCSHWHFAELGWQYTYSACQHKKKKKRSMKQNHILASSSLLHVHPTCLILKDLFSCIFHYCQCYGLR